MSKFKIFPVQDAFCVVFFFVFFFFKQKTAYEIYQCDWSSDVCSSDLCGRTGFVVQGSVGRLCSSSTGMLHPRIPVTVNIVV